MYTSAKFGIMVYDVTTNIKLFVTIAMTLDRFFALAKPMTYQNLNRFRWEFAAISLAVIVSILINVYGFFSNDVKRVENSNLYMLAQNNQVFSSTLYQSLVYLRTGIFIAALLLLMGCNAKIIDLYKKRNKSAASIILRGNEPAKEKARRETEKVLIILTIFKSVQIWNEFVIKILHSCLNTFRTGFSTCEGALFVPIRYVEVTVMNSSDFYVMFLVNKRFRKTIRRALPELLARSCCADQIDIHASGTAVGVSSHRI